MKFNYAEGYKGHPDYDKFVEFDNFLERLSLDNEEEFSKDLYKSERFMIFGVGQRDIIYTPNPEMPDYLTEQIRKELKRLFP